MKNIEESQALSQNMKNNAYNFIDSIKRIHIIKAQKLLFFLILL